MKKIEINGTIYEIIRNDNNCLNKDELSEKITDYFDDFDYIFGDYSYEKVRLKGYNESTNKKATKIMIFYSDNTFETFSPDNE